MKDLQESSKCVFVREISTRNGGGHGAIDRPTTQSFLKRHRMNTKPLSPLNERQRDTVPCDLAGRSPIALLRRPRGPRHVSGLVVALVVETLKRVLRRWAQADVGQEYLKRFAPPLTDRDAATSVVDKERARGIQAALLHVDPRRVLRSLSSVDAASVNWRHDHIDIVAFGAQPWK